MKAGLPGGLPVESPAVPHSTAAEQLRELAELKREMLQGSLFTCRTS